MEQKSAPPQVFELLLSPTFPLDLVFLKKMSCVQEKEETVEQRQNHWKNRIFHF